MIFDDSVNENKALLKKICRCLRWNWKQTNNGSKEKGYMKIKFNSDENLPLNKPLKFHAKTLIIRSIFEEGIKLYPQVLLDKTLHQL